MQILFYNRYILFASNLSFGHMGKLFIYFFIFFSSSFIRFAGKCCHYYIFINKFIK